MALPITLSEIAPRISAGAFILNSGLGKRGADEQAAAGMHGFAAGTYPILKNLEPRQFTRILSTSVIAVGVALLTPVVPTAVGTNGVSSAAPTTISDVDSSEANWRGCMFFRKG